jgi:hypothetical protein
MLVCVVGGLAFCAAAPAVPVDTSETSDNPYQSIVDRNVFSLKPPAPPADPTEVNKPTVVKITLTGMTTILGNKRVLMKTAPPPGKPGEGPKSEQSYILTEGQREGDIEVIEIDEKGGSVKVNNGGTLQTLTFEKDGAKLPATVAPASAPGLPGAPVIPGLPVTRPGGAVPSAPGAMPSFQLPSRVPRLPVTGAGVNSMAANAGGIGSQPSYGVPGYLPGNTLSPSLPGTTLPGSTTTSPAVNGGSQVSAEEQAILIEAARQAGGPTAAMLPPTPLTPKVGPNPGAQTPSVPGPSFPPVPGRAPGPY